MLFMLIYNEFIFAILNELIDQNIVWILAKISQWIHLSAIKLSNFLFFQGPLSLTLVMFVWTQQILIYYILLICYQFTFWSNWMSIWKNLRKPANFHMWFHLQLILIFQWYLNLPPLENFGSRIYFQISIC